MLQSKIKGINQVSTYNNIYLKFPIHYNAPSLNPGLTMCSIKCSYWFLTIWFYIKNQDTVWHKQFTCCKNFPLRNLKGWTLTSWEVNLQFSETEIVRHQQACFVKWKTSLLCFQRASKFFCVATAPTTIRFFPWMPYGAINCYNLKNIFRVKRPIMTFFEVVMLHFSTPHI